MGSRWSSPVPQASGLTLSVEGRPMRRELTRNVVSGPWEWPSIVSELVVKVKVDGDYANHRVLLPSSYRTQIPGGKRVVTVQAPWSPVELALITKWTSLKDDCCSANI